VLDFALLMLLVATLVPYVLVPIVVYFTQRWPLHPALETYDPIRHPIPDDLAAAFGDSRDAVAGEGFQTIADLAHENQVTKLQLRIALLESAATGEHALIVAGRSTNPKVKIAACFVDFPSKFTDGSTLSVTNTRDPEIYPPVPGYDVERFPPVRDPARLHRISRGLVERVHLGKTREPLQPGSDPTGFVRASIVREYQNQVGTGYLRLDERARAFRPTWRGAWSMTWRMLPPLRQIVDSRRRRRSAALLAMLGLDGPDLRPVKGPKTTDPMRWNFALLGVAALLYVVARTTGESPPRLAADFSVPADFAGAVRALEELAGDSAAPLNGWDAGGDERPIPGVTVGIRAGQGEELVTAARDHFLGRGFYLFLADRSVGLERQDRVGLFPRADPYEIIALMGTNGANYEIDTDSVIAWLRALERDQLFIINGIGFDWVGGRFTTPIDDPDGLARRFYAFCPDIVDQGTGTVARLARDLTQHRTLYCWWD
jgi:hypothetical protein